MLIYHITDNDLYVTQVLLGFDDTKVQHVKDPTVHKTHKEMVNKLTNDGDVFVPVRTKASLVPRLHYEAYIKKDAIPF